MQTSSNTMTCKDMIPAIGSAVTVRFEDLTIACTVSDVKISWGKPRLLIIPVSGMGQQWVELSRVSQRPDPAAPRLPRYE
jgi:hypothetical protein